MILVHCGYENVLRAKVESLRGKYDDINMKEGKNYVQYESGIKEVLSVIKVVGGVISDTKVVSKVLITLLPMYAIIFFAIQEVRSMPGNDLTLDGLVGHLTTFELSNFDNSVPTFENTLKTSLTIGSSKKEKSTMDESETKSEDKIVDIEAFFTRRLPRGKGKLPMICFK